MPQIDDEHLLDVCLSHVKKVGGAHAFVFGPYLKMESTQAVRGGALGDLQYLLADLRKVSPTLEFKYSSLKSCFSQVLQQHPAIKGRWPLPEAQNVQESLADAVLVMCNHARRTNRDDGKFAEACSKLGNFQVQKLEAIRETVNQQAGKGKPVQLPVEAPSKKIAKEKGAMEGSSPARSDGKRAALQDFDIPATRKAALREEVAQSRGLKRPAAALQKKPACKSEVSAGKKKMS